MDMSSATAFRSGENESLTNSTVGRLRFIPSLEFQFIYSKVSLSLQILRSACAFSLALYPAFLAYDWMTDRAYVFEWSVLLSFFLSTVTSAVILVATFKPGLYRYLPQLVPGSLAANSLALICCVVNLQRNGVYFPYEILVLNQLYAYFLCGLLFRIAAPLAMLTCVAWWTAGWWLTDISGFVTHGLVLLTIALLGAATCYYNEGIERRAWFQGRQLARVSVRDDLTGLFNLRYLREHGARLVAHARREKVPVSVLGVAIDAIELHGHLRGQDTANALLRAVAARISAAGRRPIDLAARIDEGRFALVLYDCDGLSAYTVARTLCAGLLGQDEDLAVQPGLAPKLSVGVVYTTSVQPQTIEQLIDAAGRALLKARGSAEGPIFLA